METMPCICNQPPVVDLRAAQAVGHPSSQLGISPRFTRSAIFLRLTLQIDRYQYTKKKEKKSLAYLFTVSKMHDTPVFYSISF